MSLRLLLPLLLALLAGPAAARGQVARGNLRAVEVRRGLDAAGMVRLWTLAGEVRVSAWDYDSLVVTGSVPPGSDFRCGGTRQAIKCGADLSPREETSTEPHVLEVRAPRRAKLWIKTGSGEVRVAGLEGELDAYSVTGDIQVEGRARVIAVESMGGEVRIAADASVVRAKSASGRVVLSGRVSDAVVGSVSGDVRLVGGAFQRGRFESIDGDLVWDGAIAPGAQLDFTSHGGQVALHLPPKVAAEFHVTTYQGVVRDEIGALSPKQRGARNGEPLRFTLGGKPTARVSIQSFRGTVALLRR